MGRPSPVAAPAATTAPSQPPAEQLPQKINLDDATAIKVKLDTTAAEVILFLLWVTATQMGAYGMFIELSAASCQTCTSAASTCCTC
jgi:hypothetical protein